MSIPGGGHYFLGEVTLLASFILIVGHAIQPLAHSGKIMVTILVGGLKINLHGMHCFAGSKIFVSLL